MFSIDWNSIIMLLLGGTSLGSVGGLIFYRRANKKLKENEVKVSDATAQTEQINLGELFMQKSAEMFQKMQELQEETLKATQKNGVDNEDIIKRVDAIAAEQKKLAEEQVRMAKVQNVILQEQKRQADEQSHLVKFVNGEYQDFLIRNGFKKEA